MARWEPDAVGRLMKAAIELYDARGYEATTVSEIAEAAGLTKRTYFRHFPDKREVLFIGAEDMERTWLDAVRRAPHSADAMSAIVAGFGPVAAFFDGRHPFARMRSRIVGSNAELQERELIKLAVLTDALAAALGERGETPAVAELAARAGVTVFQTAFARWVDGNDPDALRRNFDQALTQLRGVLAT